MRFLLVAGCAEIVSLHRVVQVAAWFTLTILLQRLQRKHLLPPVRLPTPTPTLTVTLTVTMTRSFGSHGRPWWGATHMCSRNDQAPSVLKHKYHCHLNHECSEVGFGGFHQLSLFFLAGGGGGSQGALLTPPPPSIESPSTPCVVTLMHHRGSVMTALSHPFGLKRRFVELGVSEMVGACAAYVWAYPY